MRFWTTEEMNKRIRKAILDRVSDDKIDADELTGILRKYNRRREFDDKAIELEVININDENNKYMVVELLRFISKREKLGIKFRR